MIIILFTINSMFFDQLDAFKRLIYHIYSKDLQSKYIV